MCKVICDFNKKKQFDSHSCNCQHFTDSLLKALEIDPVFDGPVGDFLSQIQTSSTPDTVPFKFRNRTIATHDELDNLCYAMVSLFEDSLQSDSHIIAEGFSDQTRTPTVEDFR